MHLTRQIIVSPDQSFPLEVSNLTATDNWAFWPYEYGAESDAGPRVTEPSALSHIPYWQANCIIAGDMGILPMVLKKRLKDGGTQTVCNHSACEAIAEPNKLTNEATWQEVMQKDTLGWGNGISEIVRDGAGRAIGFRKLFPQLTRLHNEKGPWLYETQVPGRNGQLDTFFLDPDDVFHTKWLSPDGLWGYTFLTLLRNSIGHGLALTKHGNFTFRNRAVPSGLITFPGRVDEVAREDYRRNWNKAHGSQENTARLGVLDMGATYSAMSMSNEDAEFLKSKQFDVQDWARAFSVPQWMMGGSDRPTFASVDANFIWYKTHTLMRHVTGRNQEARRKLLSRSERMAKVVTPDGQKPKWFFAADWSVFTEADFASRAAAFTQLVGGPSWTRNEARKAQNLNPVPDGDVFLERSTGAPSENGSEDGTETDETAEEGESNRLQRNGSTNSLV